MLRKAAAHKGAAFVEIFQNCNIYNDGAFDIVRDDASNRIYLRHGEPIRFGEDGETGVVQRADGSCEVVDMAAVRRGGAAAPRRAPRGAVARVRAVAADAGHGRRDADRRVPRRRAAGLRRADGVADRAAQAERGEGDLQALIGSGDTWQIS